MHVLLLIKRSSLSTDDMLYFHTSVIRPVLEYSGPAWHTSLNKEQTTAVGNGIQMRNIFHSFVALASKLCAAARAVGPKHSTGSAQNV